MYSTQRVLFKLYTTYTHIIRFLFFRFRVSKLFKAGSRRPNLIDRNTFLITNDVFFITTFIRF